MAALCICSISVKAQSTSGNSTVPKDSSSIKLPATTYMMPDGSLISQDKIDRVRKAWNGALFIGHLSTDKTKGILHLIKLTDSDMKQMDEKNTKDELVVKAVVNKPAPDFYLTDSMERNGHYPRSGVKLSYLISGTPPARHVWRKCHN